MPCDSCKAPARCEKFGLCQQFKHAVPSVKAVAGDYLRGYADALDAAAIYVHEHCVHGDEHEEAIRRMKLPQPKQCRPGSRCERRALGMEPCVAGECRPVDGDGVPAAPNFGYTMNRTTGMVEARTQREDDAIDGVKEGEQCR